MQKQSVLQVWPDSDMTSSTEFYTMLLHYNFSSAFATDPANLQIASPVGVKL
ncbi:hypothetical protein [Acinetobacter sp. CS-2]|uniref:hypothetical protein n=1 Tax=Acinetobacter sp. CS-2 TaxID=2798861 RepID=UPI001D0DC1CA|nr:hypothetical protein [Acinetobacter sp. CS-2]